MKKIIIIIFGIVASIMAAIIVLTIWQSMATGAVISQMRQQMEFCSMEKYDLLGGKYWMTCNGRPYYAELRGGQIEAPMNGWSFLDQQTQDEVRSCNYLYSNESEILFYCNDGNISVYNFDTGNFRILKEREETIVDMLNQNLMQYSLCSPYNHTENDYEGIINLACINYDTVVKYDFSTNTLSPPIVINKESPDQRNLNLSLMLLLPYGCNWSLENSSYARRYSANISCPSVESFLIDYDLGNANYSFSIPQNDFQLTFNIMKGKILPSNFSNMYLLNSSNNATFYRYGENILVTESDKGGMVTKMYFKKEGFV
jgi:hypothetical protein